jgi:hypothetical protein
MRDEPFTWSRLGCRATEEVNRVNSRRFDLDQYESGPLVSFIAGLSGPGGNRRARGLGKVVAVMMLLCVIGLVVLVLVTAI